jgi:hypothetical protein
LCGIILEKFTMIKALFGGDCMPDPPNTATLEGSPIAGDLANPFSEANPVRK